MCPHALQLTLCNCSNPADLAAACIPKCWLVLSRGDMYHKYVFIRLYGSLWTIPLTLLSVLIVPFMYGARISLAEGLDWTLLISCMMLCLLKIVMVVVLVDWLRLCSCLQIYIGVMYNVGCCSHGRVLGYCCLHGWYMFVISFPSCC